MRRGGRLFLLRSLKYMPPQAITKAIQTNRTSRTPITMPMMPPVVTGKKYIWRNSTGNGYFRVVKNPLHNKVYE